MAEGRFGPENGIDSNDYIFMMQGPNGITDKPQVIVGHALTNANQELEDALQYNDVRLRRGKIERFRRTKRNSRELGRSYTVGFPSSIMTPLKLRAQRSLDTTIFLKFACAENSQFEHVIILPDAKMSPPIEAEDLITTSDDTVIITETSDIAVDERLFLYQVGYRKVTTLAGGAATELHRVRAKSEDCDDGTTIGAQSFITVGGNAADSGYLAVTDDRFGSVTASTGLAGSTGDFFQGLFVDGDLVLVSEMDAADLTSTTGITRVSSDGAANFTQSTGITKPVYAIEKFGSLIAAAGKGGTVLAAGPSGMFVSDDRGASFTEVSNSVLGTANTILLDMAWDEEAERLYIVGSTTGTADAVLLVGTEVAGNVTLVNLSANLPAGMTGASAVAVLDRDFVMVGGLGGLLAQSEDAGATFSSVTSGTTSQIQGIAGTPYRTVIVAGSSILVRSPLNDNNFQAVSLEEGATISGVFKDVTIGLEGDFNTVCAVTDDGEVVVAYPFFPNA